MKTFQRVVHGTFSREKSRLFTKPWTSKFSPIDHHSHFKSSKHSLKLKPEFKSTDWISSVKQVGLLVQTISSVDILATPEFLAILSSLYQNLNSHVCTLIIIVYSCIHSVR